MLKISFDFDCTLGEPLFQKLAQICKMSSESPEIFIVTARNKGQSYNRDLLGVATKLNIPESHIYYTEGAFKWKVIQQLNINIHLDDVPEECELIAKNTQCVPLLIWDEFCSASIKHDSFGHGIY